MFNMNNILSFFVLTTTRITFNAWIRVSDDHRNVRNKQLKFLLCYIFVPMIYIMTLTSMRQLAKADPLQCLDRYEPLIIYYILMMFSLLYCFIFLICFMLFGFPYLLGRGI